MGVLAGLVGIPSQPCKHHYGLLCVLLLFCVELRRRKPLCAGLQAVHRLAGHLSPLPVVEHRNGDVAAL